MEPIKNCIGKIVEDYELPESLEIPAGSEEFTFGDAFSLSDDDILAEYPYIDEYLLLGPMPAITHELLVASHLI